MIEFLLCMFQVLFALLYATGKLSFRSTEAFSMSDEDEGFVDMSENSSASCVNRGFIGSQEDLRAVRYCSFVCLSVYRLICPSFQPPSTAHPSIHKQNSLIHFPSLTHTLTHSLTHPSVHPSISSFSKFSECSTLDPSLYRG